MHHRAKILRSGFGFVGILLISASVVATERERDVVFRAECDGTEQRFVVLWPEEYDASKTPAGLKPDGLKPDGGAAAGGSKKPGGEGQGGWPALVALHGHGSDRWQFVRDKRGECRAARDVAAARGMLFVSPDYRAKTSWMGPKAEADMVQIVALLRKEWGVGKVVLCGGSMGGTGALTFAALHPELVDGVVALNGTANLVEYDQFQDAIRASYGGTKAEVPDEYRKRSAEFFPDKLTMPLATTTGGRDKLVPPESVLRLMEAVKKTNRHTQSIHRPEGGHETNYDDSKRTLEFVVSRVLDE